MKVLALLLLLSTSALGCSVPVFRYALEHWAADAYQVEITHSAPLSAEAQALVQQLSNSPLTNIKVKVTQGSTATPTLTVRHPAFVPNGRDFWTAPLTKENVLQIQDSPVRQEIASKLGEGDSAVWLLLESGDKGKNDAAAQLLEKELTRLAESLQLPKLDDQDIKNGLVSVPDEGLRLSFPVIRLARSNAAESFLIETLLATEPDLKAATDPIAFPIFGRGRVLYALIGRGIRTDNLVEAASFLIGFCSCQIKEQNPGVDLIMSADWNKLLNTNALLTELPSANELKKDLKPVLVPIPEKKDATQYSPGAVHIWMEYHGLPIWMLAPGAAVLIVLLIRRFRA